MRSGPRSRRAAAGGGGGGGGAAGGLGAAGGEGSAGRDRGRGVGDGEEEAATRGDGKEGVATRGEGAEGAGEGDGRSRGPIIKKAATPSSAIVPRPRAAARALSRPEGRGETGVAGATTGSPT